MQVIDLPDETFAPLALGFSSDGNLPAAWAWGVAHVFDTQTGALRLTVGELSNPGIHTPG